MLERLDGDDSVLVDFYANSDVAFAVAAALDGLRDMPPGQAPRSLGSAT
jgi:hypothetical protein